MKTLTFRIDAEIDIYVQVAQTAFDTNHILLSFNMVKNAYGRCQKLARHISTTTHINVADILLLHGDLNAAEDCYKRATAALSVHGGDLWSQARIHDGLATVYTKRANTKSAKREYRRAIRILKTLPKVDTRVIASRLNALARLHLQDGEQKTAVALINESKLIRSR